MAKIAFIIPKRTFEKHPANPLALAQRFLNFGALSVASYLASCGHSAAIVDEYALAPTTTVAAELRSHFGDQGPQIIGLSCISAYSADRARDIVTALSADFPDAILIAGGQHFAGLWERMFVSYLPGLAVLVSGEAEQAVLCIAQLIDANI